MENSSGSPTVPPQSPEPESKKNNKGSKFWKILTIILIIIIILLLLTQCNCLKNSYFPSEEKDECGDTSASTQTESTVKNNNYGTKDTEGCSYLGTWTRKGTYVNGDLINTKPSTMNLYEGSYKSETDVCFTEGALAVSGKNMNMKIDNSDCPTGSIPTSYDYTYELECDGTNPLHLTFTIQEQGSVILEEYDRAK